MPSNNFVVLRYVFPTVIIHVGPVTWPVSTRLVYQAGYYFSGILEGPIGEVKSGERKMITVSVFCPPVAGLYHTDMRLRCEEGCFGSMSVY